MKSKKFQVMAIIAVYFVNGELIKQFPASQDLLLFVAGKPDGEGWEENEQALYNQSHYNKAEQLLDEQYPWLSSDSVIKKYCQMPELDYKDIDFIHWRVKLHMTRTGYMNYVKGDDLEVSLP